MTTPSNDEMDLLIAYALDTLEPDEVARVTRLLAERPELHATVAELRATLDKLPYALPEPEIAPDLRARTLARATGRSMSVGAVSRGGAAGWWRPLALALGGFSAALAVVAALLWSQLGAAQRELALVRGELRQVLAEREQILRVVSNYETVAELAGERGRGAVLRTPGGDTLLAARLPPLAPGRVYQVWLIRGQDAPVSGGTLQVDEAGYGLVILAGSPTALAADTFAVTDEPGPDGSPGPTSAPLIAGKPTET
ncbi:MAG TPA: anti-sigma factor [Roseiflexaceae bacterium]|nr:anti-sigma factor [Roseiflexaceae bacterium]